MTNFEYYKDEIYVAYEKYKDLVCEAFWRALLEIWIANRGNNINICEWYFQEHKEPILDDVERKYLSNVIMPFRKYEIKITKEKGTDDFEYLKFYIYKINDWGSTIYFPPFLQNTMYRGMELNKPYTLKELGL